MKINDEQAKVAINLGQLYDVWIDARRRTRAVRLRWKTVHGREYLCAIRRGTNHATSLGPRSEETEHLFDAAQAAEAQAGDTWDRLMVQGRLYKASRLPVIEGFAGALLRELDTDGFLGEHIRVVGSNALVAYELEAGQVLDPGLRATEDFDLTWVGGTPDTGLLLAPLLAAFKRADATWTVNTEREFQVRNRHGEIVDVLVAPSLAATYPRSEAIRACPLEGQEDLMGGRPVVQTVVDVQGRPARVVAPDPRLFALHKLRLADDPERNPLKRTKDRKQGQAILELLRDHLPHYPWDEAFQSRLPASLQGVARDHGVADAGARAAGRKRYST